MQIGTSGIWFPTHGLGRADLAVLGTAATLIIVRDPEDRIERFNQACEAASGYAYEEARGTEDRQWLTVTDRATGRAAGAEQPFSRQLRLHENSGGAVESESQGRARNGCNRLETQWNRASA